MNRCTHAVTALLLAAATLSAQELQTIVDKLVSTCDNIRSYKAKADVFQYSSCTRVLTPGTGRYFYKQPEKTRVEIGTINGSDTVWTVYWGSAPWECSSDLSTAILVLPVLAASTYQGWLSRTVTITPLGDSTVQVSYIDSTAGTIEYRYTVDMRRGVVQKLEKYQHYSDGSSYQRYNGTFMYDWVSAPFPVLRMLALNDDTTLQRGGYRFYDIEYNIELEDSLFVRNAVIGGGRYAHGQSGVMRLYTAGVREYDLLGRDRGATVMVPTVTMRRAENGPALVVRTK